MMMEDMKALEREHESAVRDVQNLAVNILDYVMDGGEITAEQRTAYGEAKERVMRVKSDLAKALETEFNDVIYGGAR